jgi:hypothetical protein
MAEKSGFEALKTGSALLKKGTFAEKVEQRVVIKFCVDIGKTPTDTHKSIVDVTGEFSWSLILRKTKIKNSDSHVMWYFCRAPGVSFY